MIIDPSANQRRPTREEAKKMLVNGMISAGKRRQARDKSFRQLADKLSTTQNTLTGVCLPVGKFLTRYCGFKDGQQLPLFEDLYAALCKAVSRETPQPQEMEEEDPKA